MTFGWNQNGQEIFFVCNEDLIGIIHLIFWAYKCYDAHMCEIRNRMNCDLIYLNSSFVWIHNELNEQARSIVFEGKGGGGAHPKYLDKQNKKKIPKLLNPYLWREKASIPAHCPLPYFQFKLLYVN